MQYGLSDELNLSTLGLVNDELSVECPNFYFVKPAVGN